MIVVEKLTKQFKGQVVLNGIDLQVKEGEVVAIIGPSGSGKTTFLRCLNFLEEPSSGRIKVGDIEIDGSRPLNQQQSLVRRLRQHVGFVFQNFNLFPHRTALPPLGNSFISLVKDTALAATIQVPELFRQAQLITARTFEIFTMYLAAALIYWVLATVLSHLQNQLEARVNRHDQES